MHIWLYPWIRDSVQLVTVTFLSVLIWGFGGFGSPRMNRACASNFGDFPRLVHDVHFLSFLRPIHFSHNIHFSSVMRKTPEWCKWSWTQNKRGWKKSRVFFSLRLQYRRKGNLAAQRVVYFSFHWIRIIPILYLWCEFVSIFCWFCVCLNFWGRPTTKKKASYPSILFRTRTVNRVQSKIGVRDVDGNIRGPRIPRISSVHIYINIYLYGLYSRLTIQ